MITTAGPNVFALASAHGPYAEAPLVDAALDPQLHLSRNDRPQPFFLVCAKDTALTQMSGTGTLELRECDVLRFRLEPGDIVYLPAGVPHRYLPIEESVQIRYKARTPGAEALAWYCDRCGAEVHRHTFDADHIPLGEGYRAGCAGFNATTRICPRCATIAPVADVTGCVWAGRAVASGA